MKKILVPTDFSKPAQMAVETAINIARVTKAEIVLLHIVDQPASDSCSIDGKVSETKYGEDKYFTLKLIEVSQKQLDLVADDVTRAGIKATKALRLGNAFHGIHTVIKNELIDLVVMGTGGKSKLDKMIIGSNTEKVIRHAKCPVLTIHKKLSAATFRNIVYATSLLKDEDGFSKVVARLQELFNATLHVVWVNTPTAFQPDPVVKETLQDFAKRLKLKNYTLNVFNDFSAEEGILHFADSINADLITMATHGRTGISRMLAGSVAENVSGQAKRPVITSVIQRNKR